MAHRRFSIHSVVRGKPPLTLEQIADWWVKKNVGAIAEIALASMGAPTGTIYNLPPLRIVGFESRDARILYQSKLHDDAKGQHAKHIVEHTINQHILDLAEFSRAEFLKVLLALEVEATFQRDRFAYLYAQEER